LVPQARVEAALVSGDAAVQIEASWPREGSTSQAGVLHGTLAHRLDSLPWHDRVDGKL
jgi:hypothetical protein